MIFSNFVRSLNAGEFFVLSGRCPCNSTLISMGICKLKESNFDMLSLSGNFVIIAQKIQKIRYVLFSRVKQYRVQLKIRIKTSQSFSQKEYARITFGLNFMSFCVLRSYIKSITWKWVLFQIKTRPTVRFFSCGLSLNVFFRFDLYEER